MTPPYKPENVKGKTDSKALNHVKKIVRLKRVFFTKNNPSAYLSSINLLGPDPQKKSPRKIGFKHSNWLKIFE